jgi:hypothetical protein
MCKTAGVHALALLTIALAAQATAQQEQPNREDSMPGFRQQAETGDARPELRLGLAYIAGEGVPKDPAEAARLFRKAAEEGNATAQACLGELYYKGVGVEKDLPEAARWYRMGAEQGYAPAQYNLGVLWEKGEGPPWRRRGGTAWPRSKALQKRSSTLPCSMRKARG